MRIIREMFFFSIAFLIAVSGYAVPLVLLLFSALLPDPEQLVMDKAPEREVSLAADDGLLDDAFLKDVKGPAPTDPDPGDAKEAPPEPVTPPPPDPPRPDPPKKVEKKTAEDDAAEKETAGLDADLPQRADAPNHRPTAMTAEQIRAARAERVAALKAASAKKGGGKGSKKQKCADPTPGVDALGENEWSIDREIIMRFASDLDSASKLAVVAWAYNDKGKVVGFSVKRIRCGTLLDQAGLKNGDIVQEINGKPVRSIVQAFSVWRKVRKKEVVRVKISRKGENLELKYRIE